MLRDHFHPPLSEQRFWHSFHNAWATHIADNLTPQLPRGWFASPNVQFGIEIDVATFEESSTAEFGERAFNAATAWAPQQPTMTVEYPIVTDVVQVEVFSTAGGPMLVGAIELVSPSNKDRLEHRDALVSKCDAYLRQGIGLVMVDIVTDRKADLHVALIERVAPEQELSSTSALYASAYHPTMRNDVTSLDIWYEPLAIGRPLPTMPLYLRGGPVVPVDLESTYELTCRGQRISE